MADNEAPKPWKCGCEQPGCKATNGTSPPQPCGCSGNLCCNGDLCYRDEQGCTCCRGDDVCDTCCDRIEAEEDKSTMPDIVEHADKGLCCWTPVLGEGPNLCKRKATHVVRVTGERDDGEATCQEHLGDMVVQVLEFDYPDGPAKAVTVSRVESDS